MNVNCDQKGGDFNFKEDQFSIKNPIENKMTVMLKNLNLHM